MEHATDLLPPLTPGRREALAFLHTHLPPSDLDFYDDALLLLFVDHALALRTDAPWCAALDEDIFLHYVLFPRVNDEDLSFHREIFREALWERVNALPTVEEKVLEVNRWCHENASYEMQDDRTASPLTVYRSGSGRCGEESGFLISALRSVGIPARQVYVPRWAHCDDNHAWVEALCGDTWHFLGACEPEPILDRGWFNSPASRALLVHSRVFGDADHPLHGERISSDGIVSWYNQTARYALTARRVIRAVLQDRPAAGATFLIQVLNEASFHTIATLTADERGEASIELGLGDVHIFAALDGHFAECDCAAGESAALSLEPLSPCDTEWRPADYAAPTDASVNPTPLTDLQKQERAHTLARGSAIRDARIAAMYPTEYKRHPLLTAARGNTGEIIQFLTRDYSSFRYTLLNTLPDKDLRDVTADTLETHLQALPAEYGIPDDIYRECVACPRIALEPLTPWRDELAARFTDDERERIAADPMILWHDLCRYITPVGTYENLVWPPLAALRAKRCNRQSLYILFVAVLRALGIPARLRHLDGIPEYRYYGKWRCIAVEETGTLLISSADSPLYRQNWTLSQWNGKIWKLLQLDDATWQEGRCALVLPSGRYRIITSVRMPNGNQFAALREFFIDAGGKTEVELFFRSYELSDLLRCQKLPAMSAATLGGDVVSDICRLNGRSSLLLWLEEGGEPSEHIVNELLDCREAIEALPINVVFLLRSRESLRQRTLSAAQEAFGAAQILFDDWAYDLEQTARHLTCDPDRPPLAVVCDGKGNAVYGVSGYSAGSVELLCRILRHVSVQK